MWPTPFAPTFTNTLTDGIEILSPVVIAASTTASAVTELPGNPPGDVGNLDICIENPTNGWAFCNFGDANIGAATASLGIGVPPGAWRIVRLRQDAQYVSVILATGATAGNVRFVSGNGLA